MKKMMLAASLVVSLMATTLIYAQGETTDKTTTAPMTNWLSKNSSDAVSIQNGAGIPIIITITVNRGGAGVSVKNCGTTEHIDAGSSTICDTNDANNPVTLSADGTTPASGTYQVKTVTSTQ